MTMAPGELKERAVREAQDLGPKPQSAPEQALWIEERRGAILLLAALADYDGALLRRATFAAVGDFLDNEGRWLLLYACHVEP
jgi:hypothetical protein